MNDGLHFGLAYYLKGQEWLRGCESWGGWLTTHLFRVPTLSPEADLIVSFYEILPIISER